MKNLLLMRHATASEKLPGQTDHDRELTLFGERQAGQAGVWLREQGLVPQLVLCSSSVRTAGTCQNVVEELGKRVTVQSEKIIYSGTDSDLLHLVQEVNDDVDHLLLIGHNPTISSFASWLTHEEIVFSPANIAVLQFNTTLWEEIRPASGKLAKYYSG